MHVWSQQNKFACKRDGIWLSCVKNSVWPSMAQMILVPQKAVIQPKLCKVEITLIEYQGKKEPSQIQSILYEMMFSDFQYFKCESCIQYAATTQISCMRNVKPYGFSRSQVGFKQQRQGLDTILSAHHSRSSEFNQYKEPCLQSCHVLSPPPFRDFLYKVGIFNNRFVPFSSFRFSQQFCFNVLKDYT